MAKKRTGPKAPTLPKDKAEKHTGNTQNWVILGVISDKDSMVNAPIVRGHLENQSIRKILDLSRNG